LPAAPAPSGRSIDVGGYRLYLECVGMGSPTVVIEAEHGETRDSKRRAQFALAAATRVCSYDRAGRGSLSDRRPSTVPPTPETFARELHTLLANAGERGPYVIAGASLGGVLAIGYAMHYPSEVVGLVFIDAASPEMFSSSFGSMAGEPEPFDARAEMPALLAVQLGQRPVVVLVSTFSSEGADLVRRSSNAMRADAPSVGHLIFSEAPHLALEAMRIVLAAVRAGGTVPACAQTDLPRLGAVCR
jgi:pimeloyl-ACP methyl ester carboxylesterase